MIHVRNDPENDRYVVEVDGEVAGFTVYHLRGGRYFFVHTEVDDEFSGKGVGTALARGALDDVRSKEGRIIPICPFIAAFVKRHPEYTDLIDQELWDRINANRRLDQRKGH